MPGVGGAARPPWAGPLAPLHTPGLQPARLGHQAELPVATHVLGREGSPGGRARSCECTDVITKSRKVHAIPTNGTESVPSNQILKTA